MIFARFFILSKKTITHIREEANKIKNRQEMRYLNINSISVCISNLSGKPMRIEEEKFQNDETTLLNNFITGILIMPENPIIFENVLKLIMYKFHRCSKETSFDTSFYLNRNDLNEFLFISLDMSWDGFDSRFYDKQTDDELKIRLHDALNDSFKPNNTMNCYRLVKFRKKLLKLGKS